MQGLIGRKVGMTQLFADNGVVTPVTVILVPPSTNPSSLIVAIVPDATEIVTSAGEGGATCRLTLNVLCRSRPTTRP